MPIPKLIVVTALAAMTGYVSAATLDDFSIAQGPISAPSDGNPAVDTSGGRTILAQRLSGSNNQDAQILNGVFSSSTGDGTTGLSSVAWGPSWAGFVSDITPFNALVVDIQSWDHFAGTSLSLTVDDGANDSTRTVSVNSLNNVVFNLDNSTFPGVNLSSVDAVTLTVTDSQANNDPLDASLTLVTLTETPPPVQPEGIPVLPPLALAIAVAGLGGVGAWRSRRRGSK